MNIAPNIQRLIDGMRSAGVPTNQATAVGLAVEHALNCTDFSEQYGYFMTRALEAFLEKLP